MLSQCDMKQALHCDKPFLPATSYLFWAIIGRILVRILHPPFINTSLIVLMPAAFALSNPSMPCALLSFFSSFASISDIGSCILPGALAQFFLETNPSSSSGRYLSQTPYRNTFLQMQLFLIECMSGLQTFAREVLLNSMMCLVL